MPASLLASALRRKRSAPLQGPSETPLDEDTSRATERWVGLDPE